MSQKGRLDMAAGKVWLQSQEALGSTPDEQERLLVDHLLQSMNLKLWARVAHVVNGKAANQRPAYYDLIKVAVQKEVEINFTEAKKTRDSTFKPKATTHFCFNPKKSGLPATPAVWMVALAPKEGSGKGEATPLPSEESNSGESYEAGEEDTTISQGDVEIAVRVAQASEAFTGRCFRTCKDQQEPVGPQSKRPVQDHGDKGDSLRTAPLKLSKREKIEVGGKEEVQVHKTHAFPFPKNCPNPSSTDLPTRNMMLCHLDC